MSYGHVGEVSPVRFEGSRVYGFQSETRDNGHGLTELRYLDLRSLGQRRPGSGLYDLNPLRCGCSLGIQSGLDSLRVLR